MQLWRLLCCSVILCVALMAMGCHRKADDTGPAATVTANRGNSAPPAPEAVEDLDRSGAQEAISNQPPTVPTVPDGDPLAAAEFQEVARPQVLLSDQHQRTCSLKVGDVVPALTVIDVQGTGHQLQRLLGEKLTVLVFWTTETAAGKEQFQRLAQDVWAPWASAGVAVIAVNVGDQPASVRALTGQVADHITSLVDQDGSFFAHFATQVLPRTYLLDPEGKILWFDLEYSRSTQRELQNALAYYLKQ